MLKSQLFTFTRAPSVTQQPDFITTDSCVHLHTCLTVADGGIPKMCLGVTE